MRVWICARSWRSRCRGDDSSWPAGKKAGLSAACFAYCNRRDLTIAPSLALVRVTMDGSISIAFWTKSATSGSNWLSRAANWSKRTLRWLSKWPSRLYCAILSDSVSIARGCVCLFVTICDFRSASREQIDYRLFFLGPTLFLPHSSEIESRHDERDSARASAFS